MSYQSEYKKWGEPASKFIFSQAESELKQLIEASRLITDKAYKYLAICCTLFLGLIGYFVSRYYNNYRVEHITIIDIIAIATTIIVIIAFGFIIKLAFPRNIQPVGRHPNDFLENESMFIMQETEKTDICGSLIMEEIQSYQTRIIINTKSNLERNKYLRVILWLLIAIFPVSLIIITWVVLSR